jgi:hypothetical protein
MVVEGTPIRQNNPFVLGAPSSLDVSEHIGLFRAESSSLVVMNRDVRTVVSDSMATVLRTMEINDQKYRDLCAETDQKNHEAWTHR